MENRIAFCLGKESVKKKTPYKNWVLFIVQKRVITMNCIGCRYVGSKECGKVVFIKSASSGGRYEKVSDKRCKVKSEKKRK